MTRIVPALVLVLCTAACGATVRTHSGAGTCADEVDVQQVVDAYFAAVSGPLGGRIPREFGELFLDGARLDAMGVDEQGRNALFPQSPAEFARHVDEYRTGNGFFQTSVSRTVTCHVRSASVDAWFESRNEPAGPLIDSGLLSLHLLRLDDGWRITHVQWNSAPRSDSS